MNQSTVSPGRMTADQRHLAAELARVKAALIERAGSAGGEVSEQPAPTTVDGPANGTANGPGNGPANEVSDESPVERSTLDHVAAVFGLSPFERDVLLLAAGAELDAAVPALCAAAQGDARRAYPTFSLALAALAEPHWSALTPGGPLRRWRLVRLEAADGVAAGRLRADERVLHFLTGLGGLDERLHGLVEPVAVPGPLSASQRAVADRVAAVWRDAASPWPVIQLCARDPLTARTVTAAACAGLGLRLLALEAADVPADAADRAELIRLWQREVALEAAALLVLPGDEDGPDALRPLRGLLTRLGTPVVVVVRDPMPLSLVACVRIEIAQPSRAEQRQLWVDTLGPAARGLNGRLDQIVTQFDLSATQIQAATATDPAPGEIDPRRLWRACRAVARPRLDDLAQRIEPAAGFDDIVLPAERMSVLHDIAAQVRHRAVVYDDWGFAATSSRGLGISALFAGASGTGKTMAAEVLADALDLDLYRIDLSAVVSKYIGETEKNLRRVFDAAEEGGAILLFDEADALFGKRSEVKDSHDRYANIEVGYLLQRMESYRGLAILTSNVKSALDPAFWRRIRFVVQFPFPGAAQRREIWRRVFPPGVPTAGLDLAKLARLNVPGGNIRNIALGAAFLAAGEDAPVRMPHLLRAARQESDKLERPLTEAEIGGWE